MTPSAVLVINPYVFHESAGAAECGNFRLVVRHTRSDYVEQA